MKDFDSLLSDFEAANRAGVFAQTPQPILKPSVTDSSASRIFLLSPRWTIAATILLAAGVWTMMFRTNLSDLQSRSRMDQMAAAIDLQSALASCFGGPSGALSELCRHVDFDGDGDVDLGDFGTYQRDLAGTSRQGL